MSDSAPTVPDTTRERLAINDLLTRFFQAFDQKDWSLMCDCLCDEVFTDYSSFRTVPPATMTASAYVEQRRTALQTLDMQHNFTNLRVELDADAGAPTATGYCNFVIYRFHPSFDGVNDHYFHSYGRYVFGFATRDGEWKIARIVQHLLRSEGNRHIHGGAGPRQSVPPSSS